MGSNTRLYNMISGIFLLLTVIAIILVGARMAGPPIERNQSSVQIPDVIILPSITPSVTPTNTQPATFTLTPTNTATPTTTNTPTSTITLSATITDTPRATDTPSMTPTPSISPSPSPTETATGPTPTLPATLSPFLFDLREGQVIFTKNFANTAGCAWQGLGGQVFDLAGQPLNGLRIHVFGNNLDLFADSGSNSLYGAAGWEVAIDNKITNLSYFVELQSAGGTIISPRITVAFPSNCDQNLALVNFRQVRER